MIRMEGISARYPEDDAAILSDFSLRIAPGECVLLTGPSGCGKTTVTRLANGLLKEFYGCELQGKFTLAGRDAFKLGLFSMRGFDLPAGRLSLRMSVKNLLGTDDIIYGG